MKSYSMAITANGETEQLYFPLLPQKINVTCGTKHERVDIIGLGEIIVMGDRPAVRLSFDCQFPKALCNPQTAKDNLIRWKDSKKPVRFIATGFQLNMLGVFDKLSYSESGGDVGTLYVSISLIEYRAPTIRKLTKSTVTTATGHPDNRIPNTTYTVKRGDNLYNIAKRELSKATRWPEIATLNNIKTPYLIYPDQILKMPR